MAEVDGNSVSFEYTPLSRPTHIRLLQQLDPKDGSLCFSLATHDIEPEDHTPYFCLSYTWGNPFAHGTGFGEHFTAVDKQYNEQNKVLAFVNGKPFRIQKNLHDALSTIPENTLADCANNALDNTQGRTYLHGAAGRGQCSTVRTWLQCGADINKLDDNGNNALHYAAGNKKPQCVPLLIRNGCNVDVRNSDGRTPLDMAKDEGDEEAINMLQNASAYENDEYELITPLKRQTYFWVDAICINQSDTEEKSVQVSMMDRIYSKAFYSVAWLGPSDEHTETGIRILKTLHKLLSEFKKSDIKPFSGGGKDKYEKLGLPYISRQEWNALASIYQRQWFRRAWVVQEAVLSNALIVYLGNHVIPWLHLGRVAEAIEHIESTHGHSTSRSYTPASEISVPVVLNMAELFRWRIFKKNFESTDNEVERYRSIFSLKQVIYQFWTFRASDARDKIFAYYGLLNIVAPSRRLSDYRMSLAEVYTMTTRDLIMNAGNLQVLSACVNTRHRQKELPSWVPDFSMNGINTIPENFDADRGFEYSPPEAAEPSCDKLYVKGCFIGKVTMVADRPNTGGIEKMTFNHAWLKLPLSLRGKGGYSDTMYLSWLLWTTLCMNRTSGSFHSSATKEIEAPDALGMQFRYFMILLILAAADSMVRQKLGLEAVSDGPIIFSHVEYDPMVEDMEPILADLDAFAEHDGEDKCWLPGRAEVIRYWNEFRFGLLRSSIVDTDEGPVDFHLPAGVQENNSRPVGGGYVIAQSRIAGRCQGFLSIYHTVYGGRHLVTVSDKFLGMASLEVRPGDEVWILPGLKAPAILRSVTVESEGGNTTLPHFKFLETSYIAGMMTGDLVGIVKSSLENIVLV